MRKLLLSTLIVTVLYSCEQESVGIIQEKKKIEERIQQTMYIDSVPNNTMGTIDMYEYWLIKVQYENYSQQYYVSESFYKILQEGDSIDTFKLRDSLSVFKNGKKLSITESTD